MTVIDPEDSAFERIEQIADHKAKILAEKKVRETGECSAYYPAYLHAYMELVNRHCSWRVIDGDKK